MEGKVDDLQAFLAVAREQSFTKAAAKLRVTPSALSHTIRGLEERLGIRLLARTTRNVSPTEAGERLMQAIAPLFEQIQEEVDALGELRDKPKGTIRIPVPTIKLNSAYVPSSASFCRNIRILPLSCMWITDLPMWSKRVLMQASV